MKFKFKVNNVLLGSDNQMITGGGILQIAGLQPSDDFDLYMKLHGKEFEPIQESENVDLAMPGIEKFKVLPRKSLKFRVDDEKYETDELELTPLQIFQIVGLDSAKYYLKQIKGHLEITYKNDVNKSIIMLGNPKFITCKNEPTTVS